MRAQAMENLLKDIIECDNEEQMKNLKTKASIILDRDRNDALVIRELINGIAQKPRFA